MVYKTPISTKSLAKLFLDKMLTDSSISNNLWSKITFRRHCKGDYFSSRKVLFIVLHFSLHLYLDVWIGILNTNFLWHIRTGLYLTVQVVLWNILYSFSSFHGKCWQFGQFSLWPENFSTPLDQSMFPRNKVNYAFRWTSPFTIKHTKVRHLP